MGRGVGRALLASFDISTTATGYAIFGEKGNKGQYAILSAGEFRRKATECGIDERTDDMIAFLLYRLDQSRPLYISVEKPPYLHDPHVHRYLSEIIGAVRGWAVYHGAGYSEYAPSHWRKLAKAEGEKAPIRREDCKEWAIRKVQEMFGIAAEENCAEAILIGVAALKNPAVEQQHFLWQNS